MDRKIAGFSIFELLIIIAILSILMAVGISQYVNYKADRELMRQSNMLLDEISWIKSQSIAKEPHGMSITLNDYTLFLDLDGDCELSNSDNIVSINTFLSGITANTLTVVFDRKGYPRDTNCAFGMSSITLKNKNQNQKVIEINRYGRTQIK